ncbi:uncharacterized protein LOC129335175 [Eublepharis macularius]|uniref:Uncharacterized protein LOC129335175 n=1 Tax=Eublepharis macularius TaxID=481883 RepID=A0AA97JU89_EUBMA|nr:uncharacterized protein LOC129335175 [Eublepharis macularius]
MGRDLAIREAALGEDPGGRRGPQQSRLRRPVVEAPPEPPAEQPQDAGMGRDLAIREAALGEDPGGRRGPQQSRLRRPVVEAPPEPPAEQPQDAGMGRDLAIREAALGEDPGGRRGPQQSRLRRPVVEAPPEPPAEQPQGRCRPDVHPPLNEQAVCVSPINITLLFEHPTFEGQLQESQATGVGHPGTTNPHNLNRITVNQT